MAAWIVMIEEEAIKFLRPYGITALCIAIDMVTIRTILLSFPFVSFPRVFWNELTSIIIYSAGQVLVRCWSG
jgi:hypothetical protein